MKPLLLSSLAALSGCSTLGNLFSSPPEVPQVAPVEIVTITEPAPMYHPTLPEGVNPAEIEWVVLNPSGSVGWYIGAGSVTVTTSTGFTTGTAGGLLNKLPKVEQPLSNKRLISSRNFIKLAWVG